MEFFFIKAGADMVSTVELKEVFGKLLGRPESLLKEDFLSYAYSIGKFAAFVLQIAK